ncbi:MAG: hypothetical protein ACFBWO_17665 [Paracoccaceae bacterium]
MRVIEEAPERLVLRERGVVVAAILALFTVIAAGEVLTGIVTGSMVDLAIGLGVIAACGLALRLIPTERRVTFDRAAGEAVLAPAVEGRRRVSLGDIAGVEAAHRGGDARAERARLTLVLADGTALALGRVGQGDPATVEAEAERVRRWLAAPA